MCAQVLSILPADDSDVFQLVDLINQSYRGETSRRGWTTEADLFNGNRIDAAELHQLLLDTAGTLFKVVQEQELLGCVFLRKETDALYLGMLTVRPQRQSSGVGGRLLDFAETFARESGCHSIYMKVIDRRAELLQWYDQKGYKDTGERIPLTGAQSKAAKQPIYFAILRKQLRL